MAKPSGYFVDTGIFLRWFVVQEGWTDSAKFARSARDEFLLGNLRLETVASVRTELGEVLRKKGLLPGHLDAEHYITAARSIDDLGVIVREVDVDTLERAARLAANHVLRLFDALVVDGALESGLPLLTTDAALCRGIGNLVETVLLVPDA